MHVLGMKQPALFLSMQEEPHLKQTCDKATAKHIWYFKTGRLASYQHSFISGYSETTTGWSRINLVLVSELRFHTCKHPHILKFKTLEVLLYFYSCKNSEAQ